VSSFLSSTMLSRAALEYFSPMLVVAGYGQVQLFPIQTLGLVLERGGRGYENGTRKRAQCGPLKIHCC
jgi:hypothetical protein